MLLTCRLIPSSLLNVTPRFLAEFNEVFTDRHGLCVDLKLNVLKTKEMIERRPRTRLGNIPPPTPGIERVSSMKILGVVFEENFTFREHVERLVTQSNQGLYAIRTLRAQGSVAPICGMLPGLPLWQE